MRYLSAEKIYSGREILIDKTIVVDVKNQIIDIVDSKNIDSSKIEFLAGVLCPGFINTHCHVELSHLFKKIEPKTGLDNFIKEIELYRKTDEKVVLAAIEKADEEMFLNGIVAVGDICNSNHSFNVKNYSKINYYNFLEVFAFHPSRADYVFEQGIKLYHQSKQSKSITPHAPYSASNNLLKLISDFAIENNSVLTIHNQETEDENLMFNSKKGKVIERINSFGIETDFWKAPNENSIVAILKQLPNNLKIQLVHNTYTSESDMQWANNYNNNLYWCFCVNANKYIEDKVPNIPLFIKNNCKITVGTDSLASNWSLNILDELKTITKTFPEIGLNQLNKKKTLTPFRNLVDNNLLENKSKRFKL
jgi:cytosine/adenosine deaminase-related metal-dependent hydrolase